MGVLPLDAACRGKTKVPKDRCSICNGGDARAEKQDFRVSSP